MITYSLYTLKESNYIQKNKFWIKTRKETELSVIKPRVTQILLIHWSLSSTELKNTNKKGFQKEKVTSGKIFKKYGDFRFKI